MDHFSSHLSLFGGGLGRREKFQIVEGPMEMNEEHLLNGRKAFLVKH